MPKILDKELYKFIRDRTVAVRNQSTAYDLPTWQNLKAKAKRVGRFDDRVIVASLVSLQEKGAISRRLNKQKRRYEYYTRI